MSELKFPILKDIPPLRPVTGDEYLALVEEAAELIGGPARWQEEVAKKEIPVRFRLVLPPFTPGRVGQSVVRR